jgi:hypothetical protein
MPSSGSPFNESLSSGSEAATLNFRFLFVPASGATAPAGALVVSFSREDSSFFGHQVQRKSNPGGRFDLNSRHHRPQLSQTRDPPVNN